MVVIVNDKHDLYDEIRERVGMRLEARVERHVNRRTGRRAGRVLRERAYMEGLLIDAAGNPRTLVACAL